MFEQFLSRVAGAQVIQLGFVVPSRDKAMAQWTAASGAGPWFTIDDFAGEKPMFRGAPTLSRCNIALGYFGDMQLELVEPCDRHPSVNRAANGELLAGFHHIGIAAPDFEAAWDRHEQCGHTAVFTARVPGGGRVAYFDTAGMLPCMVELIETLPAVQEVFDAMKKASEGWAGSPLSRPMQAP